MSAPGPLRGDGLPSAAARWAARIRSPGAAVLAAAFALALFSRRSAQLLSPQVWGEDGTHVVQELLARGWESFGDPVSGYMILLPKLISAVSLSISFYHYPLVSTLLAWIAIVAVGVAIARSPTTLRAPAWCALAVFMVPTDPEIFGLPLYTFWWSSLLLLLVALWNDEGRGGGWRLAFLTVGGFSGPVIVMILPVLVLRALLARDRRHEVLVAALAAAIACVQLAFVLKHGVGQSPSLASVLVNTFPVLIGKFLLGSWVGRGPMLWAAAALLLAIVALHWRHGAERRAFWTLAYLLAGAVAMTVSRLDPAILDTRAAGPRYFFLPFVLLSWMLVQCVATSPRRPHGVLAFMALLVAVINAVPVWSREHADLRWTDNVRSCARSCVYPIPVHFDGGARIAWPLWVAGTVCAERMASGPWPAPPDAVVRPTPPFAMRELDAGEPGPEPGRLVAATMKDADPVRSGIPGYRVIGSFETSGGDTGEVSVRMTRGGRLRYRSGSGQVLTIYASIHGRVCTLDSQLPPARDWALLEFSGAALPEVFGVRIQDPGRGAGEWSAVAIRAP